MERRACPERVEGFETAKPPLGAAVPAPTCRGLGTCATGERLEPGAVYVAPPDRYLLVNPDGMLSLSLTQLVRFVRPSADLLFESVAGSYQGGDCPLGPQA